jgi:hypothetical protein
MQPTAILEQLAKTKVSAPLESRNPSFNSQPTYCKSIGSVVFHSLLLVPTPNKHEPDVDVIWTSDLFFS